ncbi:DUF742 domain-containing protein [Streptomyces mangrovisoli]|uniref:DUF742 domain-containing protein n=1 Tax=Streptomyces mangrovisoli TaxID=1428628 RepID=A0A1J4NSH6_9ACTN|nr:DUF742 domain-containing protein [Streptomyces mangrovisoli]OIJ64508.1 hypothetical protein WN71_028510 [Streptomyces mangrovisoli]
MTPPRRRRREPRERAAPEPPKPRHGDGADPAQGTTRNPERLYVLTGAVDGERANLDLVTLIVTRGDPPPATSPEQTALLRLCAAPLSVAELSAYLELPFSVVTVLLTELLTAELVQARAPIVRQALPDRSLLEAVMHGLQRL